MSEIFGTKFQYQPLSTEAKEFRSSKLNWNKIDNFAKEYFITDTNRIRAQYSPRIRDELCFTKKINSFAISGVTKEKIFNLYHEFISGKLQDNNRVLSAGKSRLSSEPDLVRVNTMKSNISKILLRQQVVNKPIVNIKKSKTHENEKEFFKTFFKSEISKQKKYEEKYLDKFFVNKGKNENSIGKMAVNHIKNKMNLYGIVSPRIQISNL